MEERFQPSTITIGMEDCFLLPTETALTTNTGVNSVKKSSHYTHYPLTCGVRSGMSLDQHTLQVLLQDQERHRDSVERRREERDAQRDVERTAHMLEITEKMAAMCQAVQSLSSGGTEVCPQASCVCDVLSGPPKDYTHYPLTCGGSGGMSLDQHTLQVLLQDQERHRDSVER
ncbi:UNVERIFIED_CONTAM: hypothetical protein FKN15_025312 [Acipenser sinensis]